MIFHDLETDGQSQPRSHTNTLGSKARIEDARHIFLRNSTACIGDGHVDLVVFHPCPDGDRSIPIDRLLCVVQDIEENLVRTTGVTRHDGNVPVVPLYLDSILRVVVNQHEGIVDAFMKIRLFELGLIQSGKVTQMDVNLSHQW